MALITLTNCLLSCNLFDTPGFSLILFAFVYLVILCSVRERCKTAPKNPTIKCYYFLFLNYVPEDKVVFNYWFLSGVKSTCFKKLVNSILKVF